MIPNTLYHIYNRGNNKGTIFFKRENYLFFLRKMGNHLKPHMDILAYCLMPNHFHLMILSKKFLESRIFSKDLRTLLSSYTRAINNQENRTGSLFQQNTKIKCLESEDVSIDYPLICFQYIHQNPVKAKLVKQFEDWEMSSFREYAGITSKFYCNHKLARKHLDLPASPKAFVKQAYSLQIIEQFGE